MESLSFKTSQNSAFIVRQKRYKQVRRGVQNG